MLDKGLLNALKTAGSSHAMALVFYKAGCRLEADYYLEDLEVSPEVCEEVINHLDHFHDCAGEDEDRRGDDDHDL